MRTFRRDFLAALLLGCFMLATAFPAASEDAGASPPGDAHAGVLKTLADGLYLTGYNAAFGTNYSTVTVTVTELHNDSSTRTTGTLKIEYWAALTPPARASQFTGYQLATFSTIGALAPRTFYSNLVRTSPMVVPPDGTYWFVLILLEYDPAHCSSSDGYCMVDSLTGSQRTFGAQAASYPLTVTLSGTGSGVVTSSPSGISCGATCSATYASPATVTLTATASSGSTFQGWGGECVGTGSCAVTMTQSRSVTATFASSAAASTANYSDIWFNPNESGWGLTVADHQTQIFAVWYTYRQNGAPTWFVIPGGTFTQGKRIFSGDIYQTTGPPYTNAFDSSQVHATKVGTASIDFAPPGLAAGSALFSYTVGTVSQSKQVQRQPFGDAAPSWGSDLTDIYWDPSESGWGLTVAQHGNNLFAVWYTYDESGQPLFVVMPGATFNGNGSFTGDLYTTTGPYYGNSFFDSNQVHATNVGSATLEFDPVAAAAAKSGIDLNSRTPGVSPTCEFNFMACKRGKYTPRVNGRVFGKWISPQRYGYEAPDTPPAACEILYYEWSACVNGSQSRSERTRDPVGCSATPELTRSCSPPNSPQACTYSYGAPFGTCLNGVRTHTLLGATPAGCTGTPTLTEACTPPACTYSYGAPFGACVNGIRTHTLISATPAGCTGTPLLTEACTNAQLPPGFPTNLPLGTYRLDVSVCATLVGCFSSSQILQNTDVAAFASQLVSILNASALGSSGCSQSTSYTGFNGTSFTATLKTECTSGTASASSTVTITVTKI